MLSIVAVVIIDVSLHLAVTGVVPWQEARNASAVATLVVSRAWGSLAAVVFTLLVVWTAFASVYTGLLGASRLPHAACLSNRGTTTARSDRTVAWAIICQPKLQL